MLTLIQLVMVLSPSSTTFAQANLRTDVSVYERGIPLYYCDLRIWADFTNFGDVLSEKIVERIVGHRISTTLNKSLLTDCGKRKLLALGSIIHMAEDHDVIWCSGINGKHPDKTDKEFYRFTQLDMNLSN